MDLRITARNARFQEWQALLTNRKKRQRAGEFIVQGVRPVTLAVQHGWPIRALIYDDGRELSAWAESVLADSGPADSGLADSGPAESGPADSGLADSGPADSGLADSGLADSGLAESGLAGAHGAQAGRPPASGAQRVAMAGDLLRELGEKTGEAPELIAVVAMPADDYARIKVRADFLGVALDRPSSPGNIGTVVRSADAFGASGVVVTGHSADPYDPKAVRASTGSLFAMPVVRDGSPAGVLAWVRARHRAGVPVTVLGTDEKGDVDVADHDLTGPTLIVVGNEATGLSEAWRAACDRVARIPITGSASSLNAASAATVLLYEAARQRRAAPSMIGTGPV